MKKKKSVNFLPALYLIFGIYLLNKSFLFMDVPGIVSGLDRWMVAAGGVLLVIAFYRKIAYSKKAILRRAMRAHK